MHRPEVERVDDFLEMVRFHNAIVLLFRGPLRLPHIEAISRALEQGVERHPDGVVLVTLQHTGAPPTSPSMREPLMQVSERLGKKLLAAIIVITDAGFFAAARRAFLRGIILLLGRTNLILATTTAEAAHRAAPLLHEATEPELLELLVHCEKMIRSDATERATN